MPTLTFIRHGETNYNKAGKFTGQKEAHLTEKGIEEAKKKASELNKHFDYIYRSPLIRTKETLDAIIPGKEAIIDNRIIDTCLGEWEGKKQSDLDPELIREFKLGIYTPPGAESRDVVIKRTCDFVEDLFKEYKLDDEIFIITHAAIIRAIQIKFMETYDTNRVQNLQTVEINEENYEYYLNNK